MNEYFFDTGVTVSTDFIDTIKQYIKESSEADWKLVLQMTLLILPMELFESSPELTKIIKKFGAEKKLAVYKTKPNSSYHWHKDSGRLACLNILIDGYDSMCLYATPPVNGMMYDLKRLDYKQNGVFLLNVNQLHSVINFDNDRYLLSIGIPVPNTYTDVKKFIQEEILDNKY